MLRNPVQNEERILVVRLPYTNVGRTAWPVESKENMKDKHFKNNFFTQLSYLSTYVSTLSTS
jgi:hypothetical protein